MSSINFNSAATQALRTLQTSNAALDATQKRIATGLAIGEAKDNAAYWSISTTMKSDNKALSTVTDALGLGAATVDTAYQGLNAAKDVLDEIKSKLTAALGSNVDRSAIQAEIDSLQEQLKSIAASSTFSGENWLSVNSSLSTYSANKTVVSSFTRDVAGNVTVGEIKFNSATAVLFDANAGATTRGILDTATNLSVKVAGVDTALTFGGPGGISGNTSTAGFVTSAANPSGTVAASGSVGKGTQTFAFADLSQKIGDTISFNVSIDGTTPTTNTVSLKLTAANLVDATTFAAALNGAINGVGAIATDVEAVASGSNIVVQTQTTGSAATPKQVKIGTITTTNGSTDALNLAAGASVNGAGAAKSTLALGNYTIGNGAVGDTVTVAGTFGGTTYTANVVLTAAMLDTDTTTAAAAFVGEVNTQFGGAATIVAANTGAAVRLETVSATATGAITVAISTANTDAAARPNVTATGTGVETFVTRAKTTFDTFTAVTLDTDDSLVINFGGTAHTINKTAIDAAVPGANGNIADVDKMVDVLNSLGTKNYVASKVAGKLVMTSSTDAGTATVSAVTATAGPPGSQATMTVDGIDITDTTLNGLGATDADKRVQAITAYINVVNSAINKVTAAASSIGAVGKRIDLQQTFVQKLMDTIDKGISGLIDADMNEESTKLQALQVKQQLGVQALSIANQSAQNVLSLFRG